MGTPVVTWWRSVFERKAPQALQAVESYIAPSTVGQGNNAPDLADQLMNLLAAAYREAAGR